MFQGCHGDCRTSKSQGEIGFNLITLLAPWQLRRWYDWSYRLLPWSQIFTCWCNNVYMDVGLLSAGIHGQHHLHALIPRFNSSLSCSQQTSDTSASAGLPRASSVLQESWTKDLAACQSGLVCCSSVRSWLRSASQRRMQQAQRVNKHREFGICSKASPVLTDFSPNSEACLILGPGCSMTLAEHGKCGNRYQASLFS